MRDVEPDDLVLERGLQFLHDLVVPSASPRARESVTVRPLESGVDDAAAVQVTARAGRLGGTVVNLRASALHGRAAWRGGWQCRRIIGT